MAPPKIIYLQYFDEDGELDPSADEITWCRDRINETDLVYVLQDSAINKVLQMIRQIAPNV